ncbi:hypothetical protein [Streptacidiphilus fuscans]|uniref:Uncharacterized protein n=1 Tax=Streptacidiphilus fuscans TaxID=2789292 RepID=A0A931BA45_9ACTN|nr:hypothetical protein [Streptacidiphilus fuscans]MBF9073934.1 hypothetical protein [Streptacidiphilus fuscans]
MTSAQASAELETLGNFRSRVDQVLQDLEAGKGSAKSISAQILSAGHLGTGFGEADALNARYQETYNKLVQLSQTLSNMIDAIVISVQCAQEGYQNVEATQIALLWKIHDQAAAAAQPPAVTTTGTNTGTTGTTGNNGGGAHHAL